MPQGSILGPLLFLIFINDLPQCLKHCKSILYADDTLLYYTARTENELQDKINEDLDSLSQWLNNNLLTLNYEKTKFMIFANKKQSTNVDITIQNKKVSQETSFKYLGVTLSSDLTWHNHIDNMIAKINQRLGVLRRVKEFLDLETRCVLYTSLVLPLFDTIWGDKNNSVLMISLQVLENKAAKIILNQHPRYSSTEALRELKWTTLTTRRHNHRRMFTFGCMNGLIDFDFDLTKNEDIHGHYSLQDTAEISIYHEQRRIRENNDQRIKRL